MQRRNGLGGTGVESRDQQDVDVSFSFEAGTRRGKASVNRAGVTVRQTPNPTKTRWQVLLRSPAGIGLDVDEIQVLY